MDLELLEFEEVKKLYSKYAFSEVGKRYVMGLEPVENPWDELSLVDEGVSLLLSGNEPNTSYDFDVLDLVEKLEMGNTLEPLELLRMESFLRGCEELKRFSRRLEEGGIKKILSKITPIPDAVDRINRAISPDGSVRDTASKKLSDIRRKKREIARDIKRILERLKEKYRQFLQEETFVLRDGRYLMLVKSSFRNKVRGIVHHSSQSGATLFMEPEEVIPLNDTKKLLDEEEEREINRILRELSNYLLSKVDQIKNSLSKIAHFDSVMARAKYAVNEDATVVYPTNSKRIELVRARHPLIPKDRVVPIDVSLDKKGLVITGPNMGGKTVTLKTIGLFTALAMSGFPVPASSESELSVFSKILVDIGEEQDIELSLSSFSSHMKRIVEILKKTDSNSLVLIDELGTGTDPVEGSALGIAIIEELLKKKCRFVVTTHMSSIKLFALSNEDIENASVEFDPETLSPTYRVLMGVPGASHALEIARKLGLPEEIVERARDHMGKEIVDFESVVKKLQSEISRVEGERERLEKERMMLEKERKEYEKKFEKLKRGKIAELDASLKELEKRIDDITKELERAIHTLRKKDVEELRRSVKSLNQLKRALKERKRIETTSEKIEKGMYVRLKEGTATGEVIEERGDKVLVNFSGKRMVLPKSELVRVERPREEEEEPVLKVGRLEKPEIDIRGLTAEEAEVAVKDFIDRLVVSEFDRGYIIHGKGTGKLAVVVWEVLRKDRRVKKYRFGMKSEGGIGVTVVEV